jgi:hypothetical protein
MLTISCRSGILTMQLQSHTCSTQLATVLIAIVPAPYLQLFPRTCSTLPATVPVAIVPYMQHPTCNCSHGNCPIHAAPYLQLLPWQLSHTCSTLPATAPMATVPYIQHPTCNCSHGNCPTLLTFHCRPCPQVLRSSTSFLTKCCSYVLASLQNAVLKH